MKFEVTLLLDMATFQVNELKAAQKFVQKVQLHTVQLEPFKFGEGIVTGVSWNGDQTRGPYNKKGKS